MIGKYARVTFEISESIKRKFNDTIMRVYREIYKTLKI